MTKQNCHHHYCTYLYNFSQHYYVVMHVLTYVYSQVKVVRDVNWLQITAVTFNKVIVVKVGDSSSGEYGLLYKHKSPTFSISNLVVKSKDFYSPIEVRLCYSYIPDMYISHYPSRYNY